MYTARINPTTKLSSLSETQIEDLYRAYVSIYLEAVHAGGSVGYSKPDGSTGSYRFKVYNQDKDPEGHPVYTMTQDARTTYYSAVQK